MRRASYMLIKNKESNGFIILKKKNAEETTKEKVGQLYWYGWVYVSSHQYTTTTTALRVSPSKKERNWQCMTALRFPVVTYLFLFL